MSITNVSAVPPSQVKPQKRNYVLPAVVSAGVGVAAGYSGHKNAVAAISEAAAKCNETLIRNDLLKFWHWEKGVPENSKAFFERAVKSRLDHAKNWLDTTKNFYKGHSLHMGVAAAGATALMFGLYSLITRLMKADKAQ